MKIKRRDLFEKGVFISFFQAIFVVNFISLFYLVGDFFGLTMFQIFLFIIPLNFFILLLEYYLYSKTEYSFFMLLLCIIFTILLYVFVLTQILIPATQGPFPI